MSSSIILKYETLRALHKQEHVLGMRVRVSSSSKRPLNERAITLQSFPVILFRLRFSYCSIIDTEFVYLLNSVLRFDRWLSTSGFSTVPYKYHLDHA